MVSGLAPVPLPPSTGVVVTFCVPQLSPPPEEGKVTEPPPFDKLSTVPEMDSAWISLEMELSLSPVLEMTLPLMPMPVPAE